MKEALCGAGGASQEDCGEPGSSGEPGKVGLKEECVSFWFATVTNHHKFSGLKQHRFIIFEFCRSHV